MTIPAAPAPASAVISSIQPTLVSTTHSLRRQRRTMDAQRWKLAVQWPVSTRATIAPIWAALMAMRGQYGSDYLAIPELDAQGIVSGIGKVIERENHLDHSEDFEDATWSLDTDIEVDGSTTAPDGGTAKGYQTDATPGGWDFVAHIDSLVANDDYLILSCYVKYKNSGEFAILLNNVDTTTQHRVTVTYSGGTWSLGSEFQIDGYRIENVGSSWWRISILLDLDSRGYLGDEFTSFLYPQASGTNANEGCYLWGAQLENHNHSYYPLPYLATSGTSQDSSLANSGRTLYTAQWTASQSLWFKAGDFISLSGGSKVYMVRSDVATDAGGFAAIPIEPALVREPAQWETITYDNLEFLVTLAGNEFSMPIDANLHHRLAAEFIEVL